MDERMRRRVAAELTPPQQETYEAVLRDFGVCLLTSERKCASVGQGAVFRNLFDYYEAQGHSVTTAATLAGDAIGLSASASRMKYYREIHTESLDQAA